MRIGILETGRPPARLSSFPSYGAMAARMLGPDFACTVFDVQAGALPESGACAGYLVTGSAAGVYESLPWIPPLLEFLCAVPVRVPVVGICFGHQAMAAAYGGRVERSERGWGLGLHRYAVQEAASFMDGSGSLAVPVSHQDQVVALPPAARVLAGNAFTPFGILGYRDRAALSVQCHPEFAPDYAHALTRDHRAAVSNPALVEDALASLAAPHDSARLGGWIQRFLKEEAAWCG